MEKKLRLDGHLSWMFISWWKGIYSSLFSHKLCPGCSSLLFPGEVVLLVPMPADGPADSWQLLPDGRAASPTTSFTQQDINEGIVWYRHSGSEVESDSFQFQVLLIIFMGGHTAVLLAFFSEITQSAVPCILWPKVLIDTYTWIHACIWKYVCKYIFVFTYRLMCI